MTKPSQAQVREINRTLLATVRADWRFPSERSARATTLEPLEYRPRYYSTSDDDGLEDDSTSGSEAFGTDENESEEEEEEASWSSPETELETNPLDSAGADVMKKKCSAKEKKRRKFSCPDDVAAYLARKLESRKRRKLQAITDEMSWNQGLCFFLRRRNAWTGAISQEAVRAKEAAKANRPSTAHEEDETDDTTSTLQTPVKDIQDEASTTSDTDSGIVMSPIVTATTPSPAPASPFSPPAKPSDLLEVSIPISIPFLPPTHPVRSSIMARTHTELYTKIVRDSRTPAVPLNLAHMMRVIVQGWKDEGNWPPKSALSEQQQALLAGRKGKARVVAAEKTGEVKGVGLFVGSKHLQRGVESVRRALRLSGSAAPAGD